MGASATTTGTATVRPASRCAIGVDLGGTHCRAALVDLAEGTTLDEVKLPVVAREPERVADLVLEAVTRLIGDAAARGAARGAAGGEHGGVGIGFAGMLRGWSGVVANSPNFGWREVDFRALLRARLGSSVELYNDLNAITAGESRYGAGRGTDHMLCVYVGTGVGGGLLLDGTIYAGAGHLAGEIGHTKVIPGGRPCGCGARGCLEAYVSGRNIAARAQQELGQGAGDGPRHSSALGLAGELSRLHAGHLDEAARAGDPYARALWAEIAPYLGLVLANAVTLLNPSRVVLGGGVWEGAPELRRLATESYQALVNAPSGEGVQLVSTELGDRAGVLGAAWLIAQSVR